jgi:2-dehydro-3-deoxy-D-arabinonate dehydratase
MVLTRHATPDGPRWALDDNFLPAAFSLRLLLALPRSAIPAALNALATTQPASGDRLAPLEPDHEIWASGVTYLRSRDARQAESVVGDVYARVYGAERPELFFKALGWRVVGDGAGIRVRADSSWNVPEPELVLVINRLGEIVGYCAGNDVSSRSIEGENPLYLPQAKVYTGACALGPGLALIESADPGDLPIRLEIGRNGENIFRAQTQTSQMKRRFEELVAYLCRELDFPHGVFLMTGTGIVPGENFTLQAGDRVSITVGELTLQNDVYL